MSNDLDFWDDDKSLKETKDEGGGGFDALPDGWYDVRIHEASMELTNDKEGKYVKLRFNVEGPTMAGRVLFNNYNVVTKSKNEKKQTSIKIGRGQFSSLCLACGFEDKPKNTKKLIGKQCSIKLGSKDDTYKGETRKVNTFKEYRASNAAGSPPADFDDDDVPF